MIVGAGKRPVSVSIIAWFLIIMGFLGFLVALPIAISASFRRYALDSGWTTAQVFERDLPARMLVLFIRCSIYLCSGIAMLNGANWGRILYLCYHPIKQILALLIGGFDYWDIFVIALYIIFLIFLTRPTASVFFARRNSEE